jgi:hypothetical protein
MQVDQTKKTYSELIKLPTFLERYEYCKLDGHIGEDTFGVMRNLNQIFYKSKEWQRFRNYIIERDKACDLAIPELELDRYIYIHHLNPLTKADLLNRADALMDPENVVCVSRITHEAIHYGNESILTPDKIPERKPDDTIPWR